jgi:hypothetical protein
MERKDIEQTVAAFDDLLQSLVSGEPLTRLTIASILVDRDKDRFADIVVPALTELLGCGDKFVAVEAMGYLDQLGPLARDAVPTLIEMLESGDAKTQGDVIPLLMAIGPAAQPAGRALFRIIKNRSEDIWLPQLAGNALKSIFSLNKLESSLFINYNDYNHFLISNRLFVPLPDPKPDTPKPEIPPHDKAGRSAQFEALLATVPQDEKYGLLAPKLAGLSHEFREHVAARLAPALNAHVQALPQESLEQKKELGRWVNAELEAFGLAVQEPKTGRPGRLRGVRGYQPGVGCFEIEVKINGKQEVPTVSNELPTLELMDANPPEQVRATFRELVKKKSKSDEPRR